MKESNIFNFQSKIDFLRLSNNKNVHSKINLWENQRKNILIVLVASLHLKHDSYSFLGL